ncbi:hypothetical protein [Salmonella enterica]|uniref:Uncharacterized protein n=2 Tax=Salmonella enterica subsp. enterica serovar Agona TaxID=58095 RepID=A0A726F5V0_SALET|nr:hypothetical protein [Salmonella enterica]MDQ7493717.1 hypothetical protein [Salmonella enterica subsp. enterica serovar Agona]MDQ7555392.1 hypothetical protein [Salmonella enterica subsp. enterica serovar Agona]MDQ7584174.1 hypothetical protein [Salmonella enterica subsp. enterica serovar Agona]HAE1324642.1 hypothetical protein [Salmonella enterica subsp. enterica serovar Agona]HAO7988824.1 hypothetical protein [Salmonella enterica subsp. enterica serovar Agona]
MAKYIFLFIWIVTFSVNAGERGYYLFIWSNPEGKEYFKEYRANERIYAVNKSCWNERAGNSIRIVYVDTYPHGITDSLINSFLAGNNKSIINIRLSLNNFSDDQIPHGFDGMLIINKKNEEIEIFTIPVVGANYSYKDKFLVNVHDFELFDGKICNALMPIDSYFSP